jgi:hypothetical protein
LRLVGFAAPQVDLSTAMAFSFAALLLLLLLAPVALAACSGTVSASDGGTITHLSYSNNENCTWVLTASSGLVVSLTFTAFDTESRYDVLSFFDGFAAPTARAAL